MDKCIRCSMKIRVGQEKCLFCNTDIKNFKNVLDTITVEHNRKFKEIEDFSKDKQLNTKNGKNRKTFKIFFLSFILFIILSGYFGYASIENSKERKHYLKIYNEIDRGFFDLADRYIDEFLIRYVNSEFIEEIKFLKEDIQDEVLHLKELKQIEIEMEQDKAIGKKASMSNGMVRRFFEVTDLLKMERHYITNIYLIDNREDGKLYTFNFRAHEFQVFYDNLGNLIYINNSMGENVYKDGSVKINIDEFILSYEDIERISGLAKKIIRVVQNNALYIEFPDIYNDEHLWNMYKMGNNYVVASSFSVHDQQGASSTNKFKLVLEFKDSENSNIIDLYINNQKII